MNKDKGDRRVSKPYLDVLLDVCNVTSRSYQINKSISAKGDRDNICTL